MALNYHPAIGTIVICDFHGFVPPGLGISGLTKLF